MSQTNEDKVLKVLKKSSSPLKFNHILNSIKNPTISDSTLRRLLQSLIAKGIIKKEGKSKLTVYRLEKIVKLGKEQNSLIQHSFMMPEPITVLDIPECNSFSEYRIWMDKYFSQPRIDRVFYSPNRLLKYRPNLDRLVPDVLLSTLTPPVKPKLAALGDTYDNTVVTRFLTEFTYNSSRLEGAVDSFAATEEILRANKYSDKDKVLVLNHKKAVDWFVVCVRDPKYEFEASLKKGSSPIKELHTVLMEGLLTDDSEGEVRSGDIKIGGSVYTPLTSRDDLELYLNQIAIKSCEIVSLYERAFFLLVHISYLQAFRDGNKRTARLMSNFPLLAGELVPHAFTGVQEDDYLKAMVFYYETGITNPLAYLWTDSYYSGAAQFHNIEENFEVANLAKVELSSDKNKAVQMIIKSLSGKNDFVKAVDLVYDNSICKSKYDRSIFLAFVVSALDKIVRTQTGERIYGVSEAEIKSFSSIWK